MDRKNEIQELKDRLEHVEAQLERRSKSFRPLKIAIILMLVIVFLMVLIGIFQFVSA